ncbi:hypothetical protein [Limnospira platensis]|uniref:hypothetical protein n=1 Tax=Limnospira platensis TaxID=118562 RepID=UPI003D6E17CB
MTSKTELIKQVAEKISWTQADVKRAVNGDDVKKEEDVIACCLRYAGPELKKRNYQIGAIKRVTSQQKSMIESLIEQINDVKTLYSKDLVPNLRQTINEQANQIVDLLKDVGKTINQK